MFRNVAQRARSLIQESEHRDGLTCQPPGGWKGHRDLTELF